MNQGLLEVLELLYDRLVGWEEFCYLVDNYGSQEVFLVYVYGGDRFQFIDMGFFFFKYGL